MEYTVLGRTGLRVSVMGAGCGGPSRVGQKYWKSEDESASVIRQALDSGVNFIDTAEAYNTEGIVGKAIKGIPRDRIVLSTKMRRSGTGTYRSCRSCGIRGKYGSSESRRCGTRILSTDVCSKRWRITCGMS